MANKIYADIQAMNQSSPFVELYQVDLSIFGDEVIYLTNNIYPGNGASVVYQGNTYTPCPIQMTGWEVVSTASSGSASGDGTQPRPSITIANANKIMLAYVVKYGDLVGATVTRLRTYMKYLDGQPSADTTEYLGPDVFKISQKASHTKVQIQWALSTALDNPNAKLPARQFIKDGTYLMPSGFPGLSAY